MSFTEKLRGLDSTIGASRTAARAYEVLGAAAPSAPSKDMSSAPLAPSGGGGMMQSFTDMLKEARAKDVSDNIGTLVGAALGGYVGYSKGHPLLGAIGGASLARNVPALLKADQRGYATRNLVTTAGGVAGSLLLPGNRALGFIGGLLVGGLAAAYGGLGK